MMMMMMILPSFDLIRSSVVILGFLCVRSLSSFILVFDGEFPPRTRSIDSLSVTFHYGTDEGSPLSARQYYVTVCHAFCEHSGQCCRTVVA